MLPRFSKTNLLQGFEICDLEDVEACCKDLQSVVTRLLTKVRTPWEEVNKKLIF